MAPGKLAIKTEKVSRKTGSRDGKGNITISRRTLKSELEKSGVDLELIGRVIRDGLSAEKKEEPDYATRFRYLELALQLLELTPSGKEGDEKNARLGFDYSRLSDEELEREYRDRVEELRYFTIR